MTSSPTRPRPSRRRRSRPGAPTCIRRTLLLAVAGLLLGIHLEDAAAQTVRSARPAQVSLSEKGGKVEVVLSGEKLEAYTEARVVDGAGRPVRGFRAELTAVRGTERGMTLSAEEVRAGAYRVELVVARNVVTVPLEVLVEAEDGPPEILFAEAPSPVAPGEPFEVTVSARDDRGLQLLVVEWDGGRAQAGVRGAEVKAGVSVPGVDAGTAGLRVVAIDGAGNRSEPFPVDIEVEVVVAAPGHPDLVVADLQAPPSVVVGQSFGDQVVLRVRNDGSAAVPAGTNVSVGFYISADALIDMQDRLLQGGRENLNTVLAAPLAPGQDVTLALYPQANVSATFPDGSPPTGSLYLGVLIDEMGALQELDDGNNTAALPIDVEVPGVDLVIADFQAPSSVVVGQFFGDQVALRIRNDGNVSVPAGTNVSVGFYVSADPTIDMQDRLLQGGRENLNTVLSAPLAPGQEVTLALYPQANVSATFPDASPPTGPLYLGVLLDEMGALQELDDGNNTAALPFGVELPAVDLVVADFQGPSSVVVGQPFGDQVVLRIRNDGNIDVPAGTNVSVGFYVSSDPIIDMQDRLLQGGRENLNTVLSAPLAPGQEVTLALYPQANVSATFPDASPPTGSLYLGVLIDEMGALQELDDGNNTAALPIQVDPAG